MDAHDYRDRIEKALLDADYDTVEVAATDAFDPVWHKETDDPTIGTTHVCVTVLDGTDIDAESLEETAEAFRGLLSEIAPSEPGTMENLFGYVVVAAVKPSERLIEFATEEYTVADRRSSVFPLIYDLSTETLHLHEVPRLKGRGFYEKQKLDAESLFSI